MNRNFTLITALLAVVLVAGVIAYGLYRLAEWQDNEDDEGSVAEKETLREEIRKLSLQVEALSAWLSGSIPGTRPVRRRLFWRTRWRRP